MGEGTSHITSFKLLNFKRFKSFEMNNLSQFNLIVGDNNVGKTSLLESLLVCSPARIFVNRLLVALSYRKFKGGLRYGDLSSYEHKTGEENLNSLIVFDSGYEDESKSVSILFDRREQYVKISDNGNPISYGILEPATPDFRVSSPFIPFYKGHDRDLTNFYKEIQKSRSAKANFIKALKIIIPDILNIELSVDHSDNYLIIYQEHLDASIPLAFFGDGALKIFRLLAEIIINRGNRLMIDEIDTGIHFSRFKDFWRTILKTANDNDVQLFMTTHNEECIKYFVEVLSEPEMIDYQRNARGISLIELPDKSVKAYTYPFDHLEANISMGNDVRGGIR
jgi:AAA15 family ATPase/GTPase